MKKFLSDSLFTTVAFTIQKPFAFIREFLLAAILGPYYMGLRNIIIMLKNYSVYLSFGLFNELYRQCAKSKEGIQYLPTAISYSFIISFFIAISIIIFTLVTDYSFEFNISLYLLIVICFIYLVSEVIRYYLLARAQFKVTSIAETVFVILNTIFAIILAYYYGYLGAVFALFLATIIRFLFFLREYLKLKLKIKFELDKFIFLLKNGLNLFINSISATLYTQLDSGYFSFTILKLSINKSNPL